MATELARHPSERRRVTRQKSFLRGMVYFNNRRSVLDCLIRDISPHGARLVFSDTVTTPDQLDLHIPQKEQTVRTQVVWRHGQEIGVAFAHSPPLDTPAESGDLGDRIQRLEAEVAALKRMLRQIKSDVTHEFEAD